MAEINSKVTFFDNTPISSLNVDTVAKNGIFFTPAGSDAPHHIAHGGKFYTYGSTVAIAETAAATVFDYDDTNTTTPLTVTTPSVIVGGTADEFNKIITLSSQQLNFNKLAEAFNELYTRVVALEQKHSTVNAEGIAWLTTQYIAYTGEEITLIGKTIPDNARLGDGTLKLDLFTGGNPTSSNWALASSGTTLTGTKIYFHTPETEEYTAKLTYVGEEQTYTTGYATITVKPINISYTYSCGTISGKIPSASSNISFKSQLKTVYSYTSTSPELKAKFDNNYFSLNSVSVNGTTITKTSENTVGDLLSNSQSKDINVAANYKVIAYDATLKYITTDGVEVGTPKPVKVTISGGTAVLATSAFETDSNYEATGDYYFINDTNKCKVTPEANNITINYQDIPGYIFDMYKVIIAQEVQATAPATYTVTVYDADGNVTKTIENVTTGTLITSLDLGDEPTKSGYTFKGWAKSATATTPLGSTAKITANTKLYPVFEEQPVTYYYYVGWTKPTTATELQTLATSADNTTSAGGSITSLTGYSSDNKLLSISNKLTNSTKSTWYIVIPNGINIYDVTLPNDPITTASFTVNGNITINNENDHTIYAFNSAARGISGIELY